MPNSAICCHVYGCTPFATKVLESVVRSAEGLAEPTSFEKELQGFSDEDVRLIMHDNARSLVTPRPA